MFFLLSRCKVFQVFHPEFVDLKHRQRHVSLLGLVDLILGYSFLYIFRFLLDKPFAEVLFKLFTLPFLIELCLVLKQLTPHLETDLVSGVFVIDQEVHTVGS